MQNDEFALQLQKIKQAIIARAQFPQPAFDAARMGHCQAGSKFFQQTKRVIGFGAIPGRQAVQELQHRTLAAMIFVKEDLPH
jgi:hypothetical protein